jgi:DNA-binding CsgD family transcriptional regulator
MDNDRHNTFDAVMAALACTAESIVELPAVATLEWCDRAAWCLAGLAEPALATLTIGTLSPTGDLSVQEVSGVAARAGVARARPIHRAGGEHRGEDPRLATLRVRAARFRRIGVRVPLSSRTTPTVGRLTELPGGETVTRGDIPRLWHGLESSDILVGILGLGNPDEGRVMIAQVAPLGQGIRLTPSHTHAMAAILPVLARRAILALGNGSEGPTKWLTQREQVVLEQLTLGKSVRQIADDLGRSPHTVHDHVKSLHRKLNASSRGELVARALGHTTIDPVTHQQATTTIESKLGEAAPNQGNIESKPLGVRADMPRHD